MPLRHECDSAARRGSQIGSRDDHQRTPAVAGAAGNQGRGHHFARMLTPTVRGLNVLSVKSVDPGASTNRPSDG